ncbi:hypothetical protein [Methyloceanibacter sp.]|uniref:hypothetical protein n=1 Tax=Methyloceanibacter sp. TaxID=1965321 RepID=UPI002B55386B|nr:hypothetical protein [Methyloceanibacter sp.]HML91574.1 hypothetical protein [Methyloceanibacter sp.]
MEEAKEKTQRRVYALPTELVERIVAYQEALGLASEVEAARRLLDEALKSRDDYQTIVERFRSRLAEVRILTEVAKDVIVGHPLVKKLIFDDDEISFYFKDGGYVEITSDGTYTILNKNRELVATNRKPELDDEIPF